MPWLLVILNFSVRWDELTIQALALDEPFSVYYAQFDPVTIVQELAKGNNPPLHELLLHVWIQLFGTSEASVRFLPCVFSSLSIFYVFRIGHVFFHFKTALIASLLFIFSNYLIYFGHEARAYSLFLLLTSASMYYFMLFLSEKAKKRYAILLVVTNVLLLYTHFFGFFVLAAQVMSVTVLRIYRTTHFKKYIRISIFVFLAYLPYLGILFFRFADTVQGGTWVAPVKNLGILYGTINLFTNETFPNYFLFLLVIWLFTVQFIRQSFSKKWLQLTFIFLSLIGIAYGIVIGSPWVLNPKLWLFQDKITQTVGFMSIFMVLLVSLLIFVLNTKNVRSQGKLLVIWLFFPMLTMFLASFTIPMFVDRYLIFLTPAFFLLTGIALYAIESKIDLKLSWLLIFAMIVTCQFNVDNERRVKDYVSHFQTIKTENAQTVFFTDGFNLNFSYYYNRDYFETIDRKKKEKKIEELLRQDEIFSFTAFNEMEPADFEKTDKWIFLYNGDDFEARKELVKSEFWKKFVLKETREFDKGMFASEYVRKN